MYLFVGRDLRPGLREPLKSKSALLGKTHLKLKYPELIVTLPAGRLIQILVQRHLPRYHLTLQLVLIISLLFVLLYISYVFDGDHLNGSFRPSRHISGGSRRRGVGDTIDEVDVLVEAERLWWRGRGIRRWIGVGADISEAEGTDAALGPMDGALERRWRGKAAAAARGRRGK